MKKIDVQIKKNLQKSFYILLLLFVLAFYPLFRANFNYIDDLGRVFSGYSGWDNFSRYTSNFLSFFLHAGTYLTDISPIPQLLACLLLAASGTILIFVFGNPKEISLWRIIAVLPLGLTPYFLECLSYKFDAPYMAFSIFVSVFPFLFMEANWKIQSFVIIGCMLIMCTTYQASSGIFPMFILFYAFQKWNEKKKNTKQVIQLLCKSMMNYIIALLLFKIFLMKPVVSYVGNSLAPFKNLLFTFIIHLKKYYSYVLRDFKTEWFLLFALLIFCSFVTILLQSKQKKMVSGIIYLTFIILSFSLAFGVYPALEQPLYAPRAMYGIGSFITIFTLIVSNTRKNAYMKGSILAICWCFFVFSLTYGNALQEQKRYTDFRIQFLLSDLNTLIDTSLKTKSIKIKGDIGDAPALKNLFQNYPLLNRLVPSTFSGGWSWGEYYFYNYFGLKKEAVKQNLDVSNLPILKDTMYHTIQGDKDRILITLKSI